MVSLPQFLGESGPIASIREQVGRLLRSAGGPARRLPPILLLGETGTGKGLLAGAIHQASARASGPFVDVNCAAIPETLLEAELFGFQRGAFTDAREAKPGLFQAANGGTIFLDEVGLLPQALQSKLLKVIEERSVRRLGSTRSEPLDVWLVAATSEDLAAAVRAVRFRADLYHRLAVVPLTLPPLRERGRDVLLLAEHFLGRVCEDYGLPPRALAQDAQEALLAHSWPGNVRELANVLERTALLTDEPMLTACRLGLPAAAARPAPPPAARAAEPGGARGPLPPADAAGGERERHQLLEALHATGWNISRAAARLGVPRNTLRYRMERLGLGVEGPASRRGGRPPGPRQPAERVDIMGAGREERETRRVTLLRARLAPAGVEPTAAGSARALETTARKVQTFGGHLEEAGPGGLLAIFGLEPEEDAPRRAAHAALAIQRLLTGTPREAGQPFDVTVALHTELLVLTRVDGGARLDAGERQEADRTLAALIGAVPAGTVVASAAAVRVLARRFDLTPLDDFAGAPAGACRVVRYSEPGRTPFVGRERELRLLADRFELAEAGRGHVVRIVGDAGIGKSRLLQELRRRLGSRAVWVEGYALSFRRSMPFHPVIDMLRRLFGIDEDDAEAVVVAKLEQAVHRLGEGLDHTLPALRYALAVDAGDPALRAMEPDLRHQEILRATHLLLERGAERRPHAVVFEDAQWADAASEAWLTRLADALPAKRVLLVVTHRPAYRPPFGDRSFHTALALSTLSPPEALRLAGGALGAAELPRELRALVVDKAEGNPFFVEELVRSLQEVGAVAVAGDGLAISGGLDGVRVPDTVEEMILARIHRLDADARESLAAASVIGKDVPFRLLREIAGRPEEALVAGLRRLQAAEFLYETRLAPELEYTFKHALTHEVAYAGVEPARRRALHARIAQTVERLDPRPPGDHVERIAHHALRGGDWVRAVTWCRRAAARAFDRSANREAVAWLEQARDALARLAPGPETTAQAIDVRFELRNALLPLGETGQVLRYLAEAEALATEAGDRRRLGWVSAYLTSSLVYAGDLDRAHESGERAVRLAAELGDLGLDAVGRTYWGFVFWERGQHRRVVELSREVIGRLPGDLASERFGQVAPPAVLARFIAVLALGDRGAFDEAAALAGEGLGLCERTDQPYGFVITSLALVQSLLVRGAGEEAQPVLERALDVIEARGLRFLRPWARALAGRALTVAGRPAEAVAALDEALALSTAIADVFGRAGWLVWLGHAQLFAGRPAAANRLAQEVLEAARQRGEQGHEAWALQLRGEVAAGAEPADVATALASYAASLDRAVALEMRPLAAQCHRRLGDLLARAGRAVEAAHHCQAATTSAGALGMRAWPGLGGGSAASW